MTIGDDRREEFVVMLGGCCDSARLAGLRVRLELDDGRVVEGVPSERALASDDDEEFDRTGTRAYLVIDGTLVMTRRVHRYCVSSPG